MTGADLENHLERYLELRRALGFEMREGRLLHDFLTFLQGRTLAEHSSLKRQSSGRPHAVAQNTRRGV
jgi:hypothetical protein